MSTAHMSAPSENLLELTSSQVGATMSNNFTKTTNQGFETVLPHQQSKDQFSAEALDELFGSKPPSSSITTTKQPSTADHYTPAAIDALFDSKGDVSRGSSQMFGAYTHDNHNSNILPVHIMGADRAIVNPTGMFQTLLCLFS
jgi:hypothetical protein